MQAHSLYLHIPFCTKRCAYCDFNTYAGLEGLIPAYVAALCREMALVAASLDEKIPLHTIFFGGGTPSLISVAQVNLILQTAANLFDVPPGAEISLEANPGTVGLGYLKSLREMGVNRLSLGMQSAHADELEFLSRLHGFRDVVNAVDWARQAGFDNLNLDLIFGLPEQALARWQTTLEQALALAPEHVSLYALTVEEGTPLHHWTEQGLVKPPDDDAAAEMYELAMERLGQRGYVQYEISNWATRDVDGAIRSCRHNLQYWRGLPYLGVGAGAHGYAGGWRTANARPAPDYIRRCESGEVRPFPRSAANKTAHAVGEADEMAEAMMVGLRLTDEGVSNDAFKLRFGKDLDDVYARQIAALSKAGLLEWSGGNDRQLRLTRRGRLLGNQVFVQFV